MEPELRRFAAATEYSGDFDGACSTPYASAPSSPGAQAGFYYSAPASPTHFILSTAARKPYTASSTAGPADASSSFEFDFSSPAFMTSADELFSNGQIRPMKLSAHLQRPQILPPLIESSDDVADADQSISRRRDLKSRSAPLRRRTRSMSPNRTTSLQWREEENSAAAKGRNDVGSSPRGNIPKYDAGTTETASSAGRSSRRWISLKDFMYRSKSEGHKFWGSLSFSSPVKEKKIPPPLPPKSSREGKKRAANHRSSVGAGKSPHELHYTANRAQAEEMRKKTFLPYRQGLLGYLGFSSSSKSSAAINGFARA
ncbi:uncharacterized protein LOC127246719 [Andrographis paniculata]|uniref:uncharacterized protein LOC127246719 n=1 Tax=Andrographis paniculata TaxID=175694 RepID=UPI0021E6E17C|nr:uncharacterized protein LOC127246719 [Andrographis paniculata]